ncbi:MAG: PH domain-containing protein [Phycisphaerae bacterium]|nr:PH domain-containing protein [Phycisphaerae bacterium]
MNAYGIFVLDTKAHKNYLPIIRTNGIGMPGYGEGWFRLKDWRKALLYVTDRRRVVVIPTTDFLVLISVKNPQEFIDTAQNIWKNK